jgi:hypothetical protein
MKAGNGQHFEQAYNAQAAVDVGSMLIAGEYVTNHGNDKKELEPIVTSVDGGTYTVERVCANRQNEPVTPDTGSNFACSSKSTPFFC